MTCRRTGHQAKLKPVGTKRGRPTDRRKPTDSLTWPLVARILSSSALALAAASRAAAEVAPFFAAVAAAEAAAVGAGFAGEAPGVDVGVVVVAFEPKCQHYTN